MPSNVEIKARLPRKLRALTIVEELSGAEGVFYINLSLDLDVPYFFEIKRPYYIIFRFSLSFGIDTRERDWKRDHVRQ